MKVFKIGKKTLFSWGEEQNAIKEGSVFESVDKKVIPAGRTSIPYLSPQSGPLIITGLKEDVRLINPEFIMEVIPVIRKLAMVNQDLSQALDNIVQLGNTGHDISFDASIDPIQANLMRTHIDAKKLEWSESEAGMDGLVNKMMSQIQIGGALSTEWIVNKKMTGVEKPALINPEIIRWTYNTTRQKFEPYQLVSNTLYQSRKDLQFGMIPLNTNTYKYFTLNGDTESPYGIPPYMAALSHIEMQKSMLDNINFIVQQAGLMGFLEVLVQKPEQLPGENEVKYVERLTQFLRDTKDKVSEGFKDGVAVGYENDHKFEFHGTAKNMQGVNEVFQLNELLLASGLKMDASMLGRAYATSETQITVVFTKLLSQLKNIQNLVKRNLEFGYALELRLAGYNFNNLTVKFKPSTALDVLKEQQAQEIKIRNLNALYLDGIIGQDDYAYAMEREKPSEPKPRFIRGQVQTEAEINANRQAAKDKSDKAVRDKNKPQSKSLEEESEEIENQE